MDAAWKVLEEMGCDWCDHQCQSRDGCGCADMVQRGIDAAVAAEREACAAEMGRRAVEHANTPDTQAAYRNAARAIRRRANANR